MGFVELMQERGLLAQVTHEDELKEHLRSGRRTAYVGFDPTAASLHVGHLLQVLTLRRWQQCGHRVIVVVGGGTALVADPTGKTELRPMLTLEDVERNMVGIRAQIAKLIDFSRPDQAIMVNNADWLRRLNYVDLLREVGAHFSVNRMLTAECFKQRWEKGLSFLEFNYMIMQSYDFLQLFRAEQCTVQMGGDDQWSNILAGMELVRRLGGAQAFALTTKLLATSEGKKMGKTEKGAVWLDAALTSPYDYFQFWRNVEDSMVGSCLAFFTELPMSEVSRLAALEGAAINDAKVELAWQTTAMLHGKAEADKAKAAAAALFTGGGEGGGDAPVCRIGRADFGDAMNVCDLLTATGVVPSKSEARRLIQQGGLVMAGEKVEDVSYQVPRSALEGDEGLLLRKGKKHWYRLRFS
jgi:tyrosyl-tRNA synthetase